MEIPQKVKNLFERIPLVSFGTATSGGEPNVNAVFWKKIINGDTIILIDNFFKATKENLLQNSKVCISFWDSSTEEGYKIKGEAIYHTSGEVFETGKKFIQEKSPNRVPNGVVEIKVSDIFILTPGKDAGNKLD